LAGKSQKPIHEIYLYIAQDSLLQADRIFEKLVESTAVLPEYPYKYPPDKYKMDNDGNYRAYELYHFEFHTK